MAPRTIGCCATCGKKGDTKQCKRCKQISYCSTACQKVDWPDHKKMCSFTATTRTTDGSKPDALDVLRHMPSPPTKSGNAKEKASDAIVQVFNTSELRLAIFSMLPAKDLLTTQRVCRSWYVHVALELDLQQRLFLKPGPGRLVCAAYYGKNPYPAIKPRNKSQREHATAIAKSTGIPMHLMTDDAGKTTEKSAKALEEEKIPIILNPFFTKIWPQLPDNMTTAPYTAYNQKSCYFNQEAFWRRMQLTSPPMTQLDMSLWITKPDRKGSQLRPGTGHVATGVTLGHLADLLATTPRKFERWWMSIDGHAWWLRSADSVIVPKDGEADVDTPSYGGVFVNPSNGIPFPGAF